MLPHRTLRRRAWRAALTGAALVIAACREQEPQLLMDRSIPLGEVWEGGERSLYSQGNEELIIRDFFGDQPAGVFVDVGAAAPIEGSTTYYLEKHLGWSGIAIDALPEYAKHYRRERPATEYHNYIVVRVPRETGKFYRVLGATNLSSTQSRRKLGERSVVDVEIEVPTTSLDRLLSSRGVRRVDFLSIDIEGGEADALAGFDIDFYRPKLVCVEVEPRNQETVARYFAAHGYRLIERYRRFDFVNQYYAPASSDGGAAGS